MGNVTGAMVFQGAIPTSIGLVFAPRLWTVGGAGVAFGSAAITLGAACGLLLLITMRKRLGAGPLLLGGALYLGYLILVLGVLTRG
jgi:hypothetical protein